MTGPPVRCRENLRSEAFSRLGRMPRPPAPLLVLALLAAATVLASCGGEDAQLLPGSTAREITANLDAVQQLADEGDCVGAESAALQVSEQIDALGGVDRRLKGALREGAERLNEVVAECEEEPEEAVDPAVVSPQEDEGEEEGPRRDRGDEGENGDDEGENGDPGDKGRPTTPQAPPARPPSTPDPEAEGEAPENGAEDPSGGIAPGSPAGEGE